MGSFIADSVQRSIVLSSFRQVYIVLIWHSIACTLVSRGFEQVCWFSYGRHCLIRRVVGHDSNSMTLSPFGFYGLGWFDQFLSRQISGVLLFGLGYFLVVIVLFVWGRRCGYVASGIFNRVRRSMCLRSVMWWIGLGQPVYFHVRLEQWCWLLLVDFLMSFLTSALMVVFKPPTFH